MLRQDQAQGLPEAEQRRDLSLPVSRQIGLKEATDLKGLFADCFVWEGQLP